MATVNDKAYFEANAGAIIAALCVALVNPIDGDYNTRLDIQNAISFLENIYSDYLEVLDGMYVDLSDPKNSYVASQSGLQELNQLVTETIANLNAQLFAAKQERVVMLDTDMNLIPLVHKYVGLDASDQNIETFRQLNNIKNNFLFNIPKGTQIRYFV